MFARLILGLGVIVMSTGMAEAKNPVVVMETSMGTVKIEVYEDKAPISAKNFLDYVKDGYYDGTIFHRVMGKEHSGKDFMVQGGGFEPGMKEKKTLSPIKNEATNGVSNTRGTLAMARTNVVDSATSQFFINVADNKFLDHVNQDNYGYAVFGKVTEGMDIVDKIKAVEVGNKGPHGNVPVKDIVIKSMKLAKDEK